MDNFWSPPLNTGYGLEKKELHRERIQLFVGCAIFACQIIVQCYLITKQQKYDCENIPTKPTQVKAMYCVHPVELTIEKTYGHFARGVNSNCVIPATTQSSTT